MYLPGSLHKLHRPHHKEGNNLPQAARTHRPYTDGLAFSLQTGYHANASNLLFGFFS